MRMSSLTVSFAALVTLASAPSWPAVPAESQAPLAQREFFRPDLYISSANVPVGDKLVQLPNRDAWESFLRDRPAQPTGGGLHRSPVRGGHQHDRRLPDDPRPGVGNAITCRLSMRLAGRPEGRLHGRRPRRRFVRDHAILGIDAAQLGEPRARPAHAELWHVRIPQVFRGVPVRHGQRRGRQPRQPRGHRHRDLGQRAHRATPKLTGPRRSRPASLADGRQPDDVLLEPTLEIIPRAARAAGRRSVRGAGRQRLRHRLVWTFGFQRPPETSSGKSSSMPMTARCSPSRTRTTTSTSRSRAASTR